jgi:hypothetical protein
MNFWKQKMHFSKINDKLLIFASNRSVGYGGFEVINGALDSTLILTLHRPVSCQAHYANHTMPIHLHLFA